MAINDLYGGTTKKYNLTILYKSGAPVDITGGTVYFTIKSDKTNLDSDAEVLKAVTTHTDPTNGLTEVVLDKTDTMDGSGIATWTAGETIAVGDVRVPTTDNNHYYVASVAGTTGTTEPTWSTTTNATVTDNTVTWVTHKKVPASNYFYGFLVELSTGELYPLDEGKVNILKKVKD